MENVIRDMGLPIEVAEEFNQNFSEEEKKKYKRSRVITIIAVIVVILLALGSVAYWIWPKTSEVGTSGTFKNEDVENQTREIICLLDEENYDALRKEANEVMEPSITEEILKNAKESISYDWGERKFFGDVYTSEVKQKGALYVVAQVTVTYERVSVTYTISFDENMKLAGLYMK